MHSDFHNLMRDATRLTQSGDLQAAAAAIQAALTGTDATMASPVPATDVVDLEARVLPEPDAAEPASQPPEHAPEPAAELHSSSPGPAATASPGHFIAGRSGRGTSQREYKLFIPPQAGTQPLPLVVMLHGCTQDPDDFAAGTAMNEAACAQGFYVLYPAQSPKANAQRCWNWFKHSHQQRGRGEPAMLAAMTREVMAQHRVDPQRVYVAGLSAGGAMAAILGEAYPDLFAAVGVHSGLAAGAARDLPSALGAMKSGAVAPGATPSGVPTIVFHGDADATVHPRNGEQVLAASMGSSGAAQRVEGSVPGGRRFTRSTVADAAGRVMAEHWLIHGSAHAWSGGSATGSYTDGRGPEATAEMLRFFLTHARA